MKERKVNLNVSLTEADYQELQRRFKNPSAAVRDALEAVVNDPALFGRVVTALLESDEDEHKTED